MTCSGVMKSEISPYEFLPNIWRLGRVRDTKVGTNDSNIKFNECSKMPGLQLLSFMSYINLMWVRGGEIILPPPSHPD